MSFLSFSAAMKPYGIVAKAIRRPALRNRSVGKSLRATGIQVAPPYYDRQ